MNSDYIYFGDKLFEKFSLVYSSSPRLTELENFRGIIFDSLVVPDSEQPLPVNDVYSCWTRAFFASDSNLYHVGFQGSSGIAKATVIYKCTKSTSCEDEADGVSEVAAGWNQALVLTKEQNCYHILYDKLIVSAVEDPRFEQKVKKTGVSDSECFIISDDGLAYCFKSLLELHHNQPLPIAHKVSQVSCGKEHTLFLTVYGQVYSLGCGSHGQLGHGSTNSESTPQVIEAIDGIAIKSITAGGWHSAAISVYKDLYTWGWNESGQLGRPCESLSGTNKLSTVIDEISCIPKLVDCGYEVSFRFVSLGSRHSVAVLDDNTVWSWGWNGYGQLGRDVHPGSDCPGKVELPASFHPHQVRCAAWCTIITGAFQNVNANS